MKKLLVFLVTLSLSGCGVKNLTNKQIVQEFVLLGMMVIDTEQSIELTKTKDVDTIIGINPTDREIQMGMAGAFTFQFLTLLILDDEWRNWWIGFWTGGETFIIVDNHYHLTGNY